jgi:hypothetical protein
MCWETPSHQTSVRLAAEYPLLDMSTGVCIAGGQLLDKMVGDKMLGLALPP